MNEFRPGTLRSVSAGLTNAGLLVALLLASPCIQAQQPQTQHSQAQVQAQAPTPVAARANGLSEVAAVSAAVNNNPDLQIALLQVKQASYQLRAEEALYVPIFSATGGLTHMRQPSLTAAGGVRVGTADSVDLGTGIRKSFPWGTTLSFDLSGSRVVREGAALNDNVLTASNPPLYSLLGQVSVTHPLLRGSGESVGLASLRQAKLNLSANQLSAQSAASDLLSGVLSAYWELWYAGEVSRINEASRGLAVIKKEQAEQQVASGALARADALPYITQLAELQEAVVAAQNEQRQRSLALLSLIAGSNPTAEPSLSVGQDGNLQELAVSDTPAPKTGMENDERTAIDDALQSSYQRKLVQVQIAQAAEQLKVAGDPLRPRLDVDAYVQVRGLGNQRVPPALEQAAQLEAVSAHVGLTFETPVTDTRRESQIQATRLGQHIAERQLQSLEMTIRTNVASAVSRQRAVATRLALSEQTEKVAREQAEAERARFQAGSSIAIQVQQAEDALRQAELRVQRAKVDLVLSDLSLLHLRGRLLEHYASVISSNPSALLLTQPTPGPF
jgi:outer membrane protein TolC